MAAEKPRGEILIEAKGVDLALGGRALLEGVDVTVRAGEIVTLIGPNGAGKTILMKIVLGLIVPDRGRVRRRAGLAVGYMPQRVEIDPVMPLTVARFLALAGGPAERIPRALAETGTERLAGIAVQEISGGEMQRVLLARALLREPDLLVLDEPVEGVDVAGQDALFALITGIRKRTGCGILMVSHDLRLVMAATDTVICLNHHVCCTGRPETVTRHPAYLELFGAAAARGVALYTHHHDHDHGPGGEIVRDGSTPAEHPHG